MAGRPKGSSNKSSIAAKEAFQLAFNKLGGVQGLVKWGNKNAGEFYKIYGRLIPAEVSGKIDEKHTIVVQVMRYSDSKLIEGN